MQAPTTRFRRTPVHPRHRRCKHLRRRWWTAPAPSGKTYLTGAVVVVAMGLSTNFRRRWAIRGPLSTLRPRARVMDAGAAPRRTARSIGRRSPLEGRGRWRRPRRGPLASPRPIRTEKRPEEPSILGRVPQSKLQRSQGFGQRPLRACLTIAAGGRSWLPAYPRPWNFPAPDRRGFPPVVHGPAPAAETRSVGRSKTPEGTNQSADPWPRMQAPTTRFRRTPVHPRHRRCKHLRRRWWTAPAPSGKTYLTGAVVVVAMGLSTNFRRRWAIRGPLSTLRPRARVMDAGAAPRRTARSGRGPGQTSRGQVSPAMTGNPCSSSRRMCSPPPTIAPEAALPPTASPASRTSGPDPPPLPGS